MENLGEGYAGNLCYVVLYPMCGEQVELQAQSLFSGLLSAVYTTPVYTDNHGAELELQNGEAKSTESEIFPSSL